MDKELDLFAAWYANNANTSYDYEIDAKQVAQEAWLARAALAKPSWKDAPEWANYLAMDEDGIWFWYAERPYAGCRTWDSNSIKEEVNALIERLDWQDTLEQRPEGE